MRLVLDTNILISALITKGTPPDLLYQGWQDGRFLLITSAVQLAEIERVVEYPRLKPLIKTYEVQLLIAGLHRKAIVASDLPEVSYSPDPTDNKIIATAIAGYADYLVSGDRSHLLRLQKIGGMPVITARRAWEIMEGR